MVNFLINCHFWFFSFVYYLVWLLHVSFTLLVFALTLTLGVF